MIYIQNNPICANDEGYTDSSTDKPDVIVIHRRKCFVVNVTLKTNQQLDIIR